MPEFHSDGMGNVVAHVKTLVPLQVTQATLLGINHGKALLVHRGKRILVLSLLEDHPLNQPVKLEWVVGRADRGPGCILLHVVLEQLSALSKDKRVRLPSVGLKRGNPSAVVSTLVGVVDLLLVIQFNRHILCCLKVRLGDILIELRKLHDQGLVDWGESNFASSKVRLNSRAVNILACWLLTCAIQRACRVIDKLGYAGAEKTILILF
jgi:hypothetical protein